MLFWCREPNNGETVSVQESQVVPKIEEMRGTERPVISRFYCFCLRKGLMYDPGWLMIVLPPFPKCWDSKSMPFMIFLQKGSVTSTVMGSEVMRGGGETPTLGHREN